MGNGTYVFTHSLTTWHAKVSLAVLGCGGIAAASHKTAAYLHGIGSKPERIEVVTNRTGRRRFFVLHQSTDLADDHISYVDGIPTTTVARTVVDIGVPHGLGTTARTIDEARRQGLVELKDVATLLHTVARRGRNGVGPARKILEERLKWDQITDSQLEDRFLRILQNGGAPKPTEQHTVHNHEGKWIARVDFAYPDRKLAVELDGLAYHSDPGAFRWDRQRQNQLVLAGWTVLRFTYWDVFAGGGWVLDQVLASLTPRN